MRIISMALPIIVASIIVWPHHARSIAETLEFYLDAAGNKITKVEAAKALILENTESVYRCYQVEMSDKLTIRKKK